MIKLLNSWCTRCSEAGAHLDHFLLHINIRLDIGEAGGSRPSDVLGALDCDGGVPSVRLHHEIYLGDPRRTKPESLRTVIRHPVA